MVPTGYQGKRDQLTIRVDGINWLSGQKDSIDYQGKRINWPADYKIPNNYQLVMRAKQTTDYEGRRD